MVEVHFLSVLKSLRKVVFPVLGDCILASKYISIDLSETNEKLNKVDIASSIKLGHFINEYLETNKALVAYGGYLEHRNIYKRSKYFNKQVQEERNIHIGMDLWCNSGTKVYAPINAKVHSFKNNTNFGDYGPTIILEHQIDGLIFYTLYGHLSLDSIQGLKLGQLFNKGDVIATLGDETVNGDYPPHLHFQIIKDIQDYKGDYPGVCNKKDLEFYKTNCPDPDILLYLNKF